MDVVEIINQKYFLGQEFLTWLWYFSEEEDFLELSTGKRVAVMLGDRLVLGPAQGQEGTRVTVRGQEISLAEAREALRQGKLVESLRLGLAVDGEEYLLNLRAADLGISALKLPPTAGTEEGEEGQILERVALIEEVTAALDGLFAHFLMLRLADNGGPLAEGMAAWAQRED
ncbi:MAG: hypothetical protein KQJ78_21100 [Deltaproteobacteria bacterium]|nr:hypothetical protein [Deltaproteobacteria bacterium]